VYFGDRKQFLHLVRLKYVQSDWMVSVHLKDLKLLDLISLRSPSGHNTRVRHATQHINTIEQFATHGCGYQISHESMRGP